MGLKEQLERDLHTAMRDRDETTTSTLRMVLTAIRTEEVAGKSAKVLDDPAIQKVLVREAKKRTEAAEAYRAAGRLERASREEAEREVIETYLPAPIPEAELEMLVRAAVEESRPQGRGAFGAAMKILGPQTVGRADGKMVAELVRKHLES